jgi:hypothetical protein
MWATLKAVVDEFTRPTYSAICLGLLPAGAMMVGAGIRVAMAEIAISI